MTGGLATTHQQCRRTSACWSHAISSETVRGPLLAACLVAFACATAFCLGPPVSWAQTNAEETVQFAMTKGENGMYRAYNAVFVKWHPPFGDASAVALTKILADKPIAVAEIPVILIVLSDSYDSPISIEDGLTENRGRPVCTEFSIPPDDRPRDDQKDRGHHSLCRGPVCNLCEGAPHRVIPVHRKLHYFG